MARVSQPSPLAARSLLFLGALVVALSMAEAALRLSGFTHFNPYMRSCPA
jgi:hypothetical protein